MGEVQRIFYIHFSLAMTALFAYFFVFVGSIGYLWKRARGADDFAYACAEVGFVYCCGVLVTGPLWAKPVWGIWWTWDPRLTSTFILWLLYIAYLLLRGLLEDPQRRATLSAVFGIFAFLDAPLVYVSNRLWRTQHPAPVMFGGENSYLDPTMAKVLVLCICALLPVMILVLVDRYRLEGMRHEVELSLIHI